MVTSQGWSIKQKQNRSKDTTLGNNEADDRMTLHRYLSQSGNGQTNMICKNDMKDDAKESGDQLYCRRLLKDPIGAVLRGSYCQWLGVYHREI